MPGSQSISGGATAGAPRVRIGALAAIEARGPYTCPRHPSLRRAFPGSCPKCAMPLIAWRDRDVLAATEEEYRWLVGRLRLAVVAAIGCLLLGMADVPVWVGAWSLELQFLLAVPVLVWSAQPILTEAWRAFRAGRGDVHQPLAGALLVAFAAGVVGTVDPTFLGTSAGRAVVGLAPYAAATAAIAAALFVRWVSVAVAKREIVRHRKRFVFHDGTARVVRDFAETETLVAYLQRGEHVRVLGGEPVPVDGFVIEGSGRAARYPVGLGGEAHLGPGDYAYAGTVLAEGAVTLLATETGERVAMREFGRVPAGLDPGGFCPGAEPHALPGSFWAVIGGLAAAGAGLCLFVRPDGVLAAVFAVLVGATPCGAAYLGLPLRVIALLRAARLGALLHGDRALERLAQVSGGGVEAFDPAEAAGAELHVLGPGGADRALLAVGASLAVEAGSVFAGAWVRAAGPGDFPECTRVRRAGDGGLEGVFLDGEYALVPAEACAGRELTSEYVLATHHLVRGGRTVLSVSVAPQAACVRAGGDAVVGFVGEWPEEVSGDAAKIALATGRLREVPGCDATLVRPSGEALRALSRLAARFGARVAGQRQFLMGAAYLCAVVAAGSVAWVPGWFPAAVASALLPVVPVLWPVVAALRRVRP